FGGFFESRIDFLNTFWVFNQTGQISKRTIGNRYTYSSTAQFAFQSRKNLGDGFCSSGSCGNYTYSGSSGPAKIFVWGVMQFLIAGIRVDGGNVTAFNSANFI